MALIDDFLYSSQAIILIVLEGKDEADKVLYLNKDKETLNSKVASLELQTQNDKKKHENDIGLLRDQMESLESSKIYLK